MTISPKAPILKPYKNDENIKVLMDEHITFMKIGFGYSLMVRIKPGFITDGASIPMEALRNNESRVEIVNYLCKKYSTVLSHETVEDFLTKLINKIIGTPWDVPRLLAAIVHDALYGVKWKFRWLCDLVYKIVLLENNYDAIRAESEYMCIRLAGWRNWNSVTKEEKKKTKELVSVAFVKTNKVGKIKEQLKREEERK